MNKVVIFGGTGYIGRNLAKLLSKDYKIIIVSRSARRSTSITEQNTRFVEWDYKNVNTLSEIIENSYAVINLAGENISGKRWTKKYKQKLIDSRINVSAKIIKTVNESNTPPKVFIQGSAIGYYPFDYKNEITEMNGNGHGFLAKLVKDWESNTEELNWKNIRIVIIRTGVVIGKNANLIKRLKTSFKAYLGGHFGNGKQFLSWIHIQDQINAIKFLLENNTCSGKYNLTAPIPVEMKTFSQQFGQVIQRPSWFHIPPFILKMAFGQMAEEILVNGSKVLPHKLLDSGFEFEYNYLLPALEQILKDKE